MVGAPACHALSRIRDRTGDDRPLFKGQSVHKLELFLGGLCMPGRLPGRDHGRWPHQVSAPEVVPYALHAHVVVADVSGPNVAGAPVVGAIIVVANVGHTCRPSQPPLNA